MAGEGYGDLQQPTAGYDGADAGGYGGNDSGFDYLVKLDETKPAAGTGSGSGATAGAPATASSAPTPPPPPVDRQKVAEDLVADLAERFRKRFSKQVKKKGNKKQRVTLGPDIGNKPKVEIVADSDFLTRLTQHGDLVFEEYVKSKLCLDPQSIQDRLIRLYELDGTKFPYDLPFDCRTTVLKDDDKIRLFNLAKVLLQANLKKEADHIAGFFEDTGGPGTMVLRESLFASEPFQHELVATVAHELSHACAFGGWDFFLSDMQANGLKKVGDLDEGMTTEIGNRIAQDWFKDQSNSLVPPKPYEKEQWDTAASFIKAMTEAKAFEAYFGGFIKLKDFAKPKGEILVGDAKPKTWTWPWQ